MSQNQIELTYRPAKEVDGAPDHCHPDEPLVVEKGTGRMVRGQKQITVHNDEPVGVFTFAVKVYDSEDLE
jgi:mannose-6-phosphate isomerase-like protein (cupin superfamily)